MLPDTAASLLIVVLFILPGSVYTWAFERQNSAYGVTFADRFLRFLATSVVFHVLLAWPEYAVYRWAVAGRTDVPAGQFAVLWAGLVLLVGAPALLGTTLGGLYASRTDRRGWDWIRRRLSAPAETRLLTVVLGRSPAPRAWDNMFSERPSAYLRIRLTGDEGWVAGRFASRSYAGGFPHAADLYLEQAWQIDQETGRLGESGLGFPIYVTAGSIAYIEALPEQGSAPARGDADA